MLERLLYEDGKVVDDIRDIQCVEWKKSLEMENLLHQELMSYVTINPTFHDLYEHMNNVI